MLHWLAEGKSNWETGQILECTEETVKKHRCHIYRTLDVANAISAAAFYWQATMTLSEGFWKQTSNPPLALTGSAVASV